MADGFCEACGYSPRDAEREADRARDAVRGEAEQAKIARNRAEARALTAEARIAEIEAGATKGPGTMESARAATSYMRIRFDKACTERDSALILLREALLKNGPRAHADLCDGTKDCWMCRARALLGIEEGR